MSKKVGLAVIMVLLMVGVVLSGCATPNTSNTSTDSATISTYNSSLGYKITYPAGYDSNEDYSVWTAENKDISLLESWGINKQQESVIVVSVYPLGEEAKILDDNKYVNGKVLVTLPSGVTAAELITQTDSPAGLLIEGSEYVYIITGSQGNKEYDDILNTFSLVSS